MGSRLVNVYYKDNIFMTYDLSCFDDCIDPDDLYMKLADLFDTLQDAVFDKENQERIDREKNNIWSGHENLREIANSKFEELKNEYSYFEALDLLFEQLKSVMSEEDYSIWRMLRDKEVKYDNECYNFDTMEKYIHFECNGRESYLPFQ